MILQAPAKLNLCLYLGPLRGDGLHEIRSVFSSISLADALVVTEAQRDEVICESLPGPDLTARALAALREAGWSHPPVRIEVRKRIPIAAGLGGGSADAAAVLRMAAGEVEGLAEIAAGLGADVPSQLVPGPCLVAGAGERVEPIERLGPHEAVVVPDPEGLSTADVYREADRIGLPRTPAELDQAETRLRAASRAGEFPLGSAGLLVNDLEPAALSLRPEIDRALEALRRAGAQHATISGSGPTAVGLFSPGASSRATAELRESFPGALRFGQPPGPRAGGGR